MLKNRTSVLLGTGGALGGLADGLSKGFIPNITLSRNHRYKQLRKMNVITDTDVKKIKNEYNNKMSYLKSLEKGKQILKKCSKLAPMNILDTKIYTFKDEKYATKLAKYDKKINNMVSKLSAKIEYEPIIKKNRYNRDKLNSNMMFEIIRDKSIKFDKYK